MAYDFNGTNQDFSMASSPVSGVPLTIAAWFNADNTTAATQLVAVAQGSLNRSYYGLNIRGDVSGDPVEALAYDSGAAKFARTTSAYSANTWTHGCAVFSALNNRTAYINGGDSGTDTVNTAAFTPSVTRMAVFVDGNGNKSAYLDGRLADVGIWNVALTAAEVASLAKGVACSKVRPQSLVFYAPLIRDLIDVRGGLTITNNNTATVANHPRVYA